MIWLLLQVKQPLKKAPIGVLFLVADLPMVKNQAVRGATGDILPVAMTQWRSHLSS